MELPMLWTCPAVLGMLLWRSPHQFAGPAFRVTTHDAQALLILKLQAVTCMAMYECS